MRTDRLLWNKRLFVACLEKDICYHKGFFMVAKSIKGLFRRHCNLIEKKPGGQIWQLQDMEDKCYNVCKKPNVSRSHFKLKSKESKRNWLQCGIDVTTVTLWC